MKRKFVRVMLFGALTLSTVTYVGCKDYDDDISNLQTQIDANKASIADLQKFVNEGKWVKDVTSITGGFKVTFNDGKSYEIVNGVNGVNGVKGDKGDTGAAGTPGTPGSDGTNGADGAPGSKVTIDPETGEWLIDNEPTGWFAIGKDGTNGTNGTNGHSPFIGDGTNGDKGYWYFWNEEKAEFAKGDKAQGENGESIKGTDGKSPFINADGLWVYYNAAGEQVIGAKASGTNGINGSDGKDAQSPFIGEDGYWYYWDATVGNEDGTTGKLVAGAYAQTSVYIVEAENRPAWELHVGIMGKDGKITDTTIILPKADKLSSMAAVTIFDGKISEGMDAAVTMYYGILAKGTTVVFNKVTYGSTEKATTLVGANSGSFHALINPVSVDFSQYPVELVNSHGDAFYTVTSKEKNFSDAPLLTRATEKKWNQGVYDLNISLIGDKANADLNDKNIAYALRAKDAWGNDLISRYDVKIIAKNEAKDVDDAAVDVDYTSSANLDKLFANELAKVAAHYYTIAAADLKAIGATFDEASSTISAPTMQGSINVKINYLKTDGTKKEVEDGNAKTFKVNFTYNTGDDITIDNTVVWNLTKGASTTDITKNKSELTIKSTDPLFSLLNKEFTGKVKPTVRLKSIAFASGDKITVDGKEYAIVAKSIVLAAGQPVAVKDADDNITGYKITFNFDPTKVAAVKHNAVLEVLNPDYTASSGLNDEVLKKVKVTVDVKNPGVFAFEPLRSYFINTSDATSYGTPSSNMVTENLYNLFDEITVADKTRITFTEEVPNFGTTETPEWGANWLQRNTNATIQVPLFKSKKNDGVYSERGLTIAYQPFANIRLNAISKAFNLTVKSAIKEGEATYKADATSEDKQIGILSLAHSSFTIQPSEFVLTDVYGVRANIASDDTPAITKDSRLKTVTIELETEIAKYAELELVGNSFTGDVKVKLKASTIVINTKLEGNALVKVIDVWGAETVVKCPITLSPAK